MKTVIELIQMLKELTNNKEFIERHKNGEQSFMRKKKLDFQSVFFFVLSLVKQSLDFDSEHFFGTLGIKVWPSAITQRRAQIKWTAFEEALEQIALHYPKDRTMNGYRIIAVDGIHGELPRQPELIEEYGLVGESSYPQFHAVAAFDVLNEFFLCASWNKSPTDERKAASKLLEAKAIPENALFVYDRGYPGIELIKRINDKGYKFVMRASSNAFKEVSAFAASGKREDIVTICYDKKRANWNKHQVMGIELPYTCLLRCVRVDLPSGETEILISNLKQEEWSADEFSKLYTLRWGIETNFNHLKNAIHIETFIGIKDNSIRQEFYASLLKYSLLRLAVIEAQAVRDEKKT